MKQCHKAQRTTAGNNHTTQKKLHHQRGTMAVMRCRVPKGYCHCSQPRTVCNSMSHSTTHILPLLLTPAKRHPYQPQQQQQQASHMRAKQPSQYSGVKSDMKQHCWYKGGKAGHGPHYSSTGMQQPQGRPDADPPQELLTAPCACQQMCLWHQ